MSSTKSLIKLAFDREVGLTMNVAIGALIEIGAESLVDEFTMKNYLPGQAGAVGVEKAKLAPFLADDKTSDPEKPLKARAKEKAA